MPTTPAPPPLPIHPSFTSTPPPLSVHHSYQNVALFAPGSPARPATSKCPPRASLRTLTAPILSPRERPPPAGAMLASMGASSPRSSPAMRRQSSPRVVLLPAMPAGTAAAVSGGSRRTSMESIEAASEPPAASSGVSSPYSSAEAALDGPPDSDAFPNSQEVIQSWLDGDISAGEAKADGDGGSAAVGGGTGGSSRRAGLCLGALLDEAVPPYEDEDLADAALHQLRLAIVANLMRLETLFHEFDLNNDGVISLHEFNTLLWCVLGESKFTRKVVMKQLFTEFDHDRSGHISMSEFCKVLHLQCQARQDLKAEAASGLKASAAAPNAANMVAIQGYAQRRNVALGIRTQSMKSVHTPAPAPGKAAGA